MDDEDDVKKAEYISVTKRRLLELRSATKEDRSMQQLQQIIGEGWPENKIHLDLEVRSYFSMQNEMTVQDSLIFRGNCVVVPMIQRGCVEGKAAFHTPGDRRMLQKSKRMFALAKYEQ